MSPRKLVEFDDETMASLVLLGRDRMATLQELAENRDHASNEALRHKGSP